LRTSSVRAFFFFSSRRRHTRFSRDWSSDVCSSDLFVSKDKPDKFRKFPTSHVSPILLAASSGTGSQPVRHPLRLPLGDVSAFCHLPTEKFPDSLSTLPGKSLMRDSATFDAQRVIAVAAVASVVIVPRCRSHPAVRASWHFEDVRLCSCRVA